MPIHIRAPEAPGEVEAAGPTPVQIKIPVRRKKKKLGLMLGVAALAVLAAGGGYVAYTYFMVPPPPPPKPALKAGTKPVAKAPAATPAAKAGPTPSETLNALAAAPGKMIANAQNAVAGRRGSEQDRVDAMLDGKDVPDQRGLRTPLPGELGGRAAAAPAAPSLGKAAASTTVSPGVSAYAPSSSEIQATAEASPAFLSFVADAKVSGVFQGEPSRAFINGRLARSGTVIEEGLGITFVGVDSENRLLLFKDRNGARVTKRY
jgi:hypothetical protein